MALALGAEVGPPSRRVSDYHLNPRWVCWMLSRGDDPRTFVCTRLDGEVPRVADEAGRVLPRTLVFSQWVQARWREWASELGFADRNGRLAHEVALGSGRTHADFDAWLSAKVGAS